MAKIQYFEIQFEHVNGRAVINAVEKRADQKTEDIWIVAGGDNTVIVGCTSKTNMTRDKLQELIWELNDGAWCDVKERTEDELDKRELI